MNKLNSFAEGISKLGLTEVGYAIALLWFFDQEEGKPEQRPAFLAEAMHDLSLRGRVNVTRLARQLLSNSDVMRGKETGTVKLRLASKSRLAARYNEIIGTVITPKIEPHIIPTGLLSNTRAYLETLVFQINGSYQYGFYDACAVMCRRLLECLLIAAFERSAKGDAIRDSSGDYRPLSELIGLASSGQHIKLARGANVVMNKMKEVGDLAAHHPNYTARQKDIDDQRVGFGRVVSELVHLAEITPRAPG